MENWSQSIPTDFTINFFLDTNILSFYLDKEYPCLNATIDYLLNSEYVALISSETVFLELVTVRRRTHYRKIIQNNFPYAFPDGSTELAKLEHKIKKYGDVPKILSYKDVRNQVKEKVVDEIDYLRSLKPDLDFSNNTFHKELYEITSDLILSSSLSRSDSLVLSSALLPSPQEPEKQIYILSKDKQFVDEFKRFDLEVDLGKRGLTEPDFDRITSLNLSSGKHLDLTNESHIPKVKNFWIEKIKELIIQKQEDLFLGRTHLPHSPASSPENCFDFQLNPLKTLHNNMYLIVISNSLDFNYYVNVPPEFWNTKKIASYPFASNMIKNISFLCQEYQGDNTVSTKSTIMDKLKDDGHLVFVNPSSFE